MPIEEWYLVYCYALCLSLSLKCILIIRSLLWMFISLLVLKFPQWTENDYHQYHPVVHFSCLRCISSRKTRLCLCWVIHYCYVSMPVSWAVHHTVHAPFLYNDLEGLLLTASGISIFVWFWFGSHNCYISVVDCRWIVWQSADMHCAGMGLQ